MSDNEGMQKIEQALRVPVQREDSDSYEKSSLGYDSRRIDIGFTGTRQGMNELQYESVNEVLKGLNKAFGEGDNHKFLWAHHGDCLGADAEFHDLAVDHGFFVHVHPPENDRLRAYAKGSRIDEPKPYKDRNHDIVRASDLLIATPSGLENDGDQKFSGTWATVRIARKLDVPYIIYYRDGSIG